MQAWGHSPLGASTWPLCLAASDPGLLSSFQVVLKGDAKKLQLYGVSVLGQRQEVPGWQGKQHPLQLSAGAFQELLLVPAFVSPWAK